MTTADMKCEWNPNLWRQKWSSVAVKIERKGVSGPSWFQGCPSRWLELEAGIPLASEGHVRDRLQVQVLKSKEELVALTSFSTRRIK